MMTLSSVNLLLLLSSLAHLSHQCPPPRRPPQPPTAACDRSIDPAALIPNSNHLSVEHPDGRTGTIHLERFYTNDEERAGSSNDSTHCRFTGHLANDPEGSCVAMTGCPGGSEDVELTVLSGKFGNAMLLWKADGSIEDIPHPYAAVSPLRDFSS